MRQHWVLPAVLNFIFVVGLQAMATWPRSAAAEIKFLQVEGMILGYYPKLAMGVQVKQVEGSKEIKLSTSQKCLESAGFERIGIPYENLSYGPEDRQMVRNKMTGLIGYPGLSLNGLKEDWLRSAHGLAVNFYKDNLATPPGDNELQIVFVPMVLSPEPIILRKAEWTAEAKQILQNKGWDALEDYCGSHFIVAVGEEHYVVYSIRVKFNDAETRRRMNSTFFPASSSPSILMSDIYRMRQLLQLSGYDTTISVDILQVGGLLKDAEDLQNALRNDQNSFETEAIPDSALTRAQMTCAPYYVGPCQKLVQTFMDYQFGRLNFTGVKPTYAPVRFRLAPLKYANTLTQ